MSNYYGEISLTKLGELIKKQPSLVKEVTFKDGHKEKMLNISVVDKKSQYSDAFVAASCKKENRIEGVGYILGNLKLSEMQPMQSAQPAPTPTPAPTASAAPVADPIPQTEDDLPF